MRIHILGICGTFMGGLAMLARQLGHEVTGSDANVYPPMSTLLEKQGIELIQGYDASQLDPQPDLVIIGNAMTRGNPCVEAVLEKREECVFAVLDIGKEKTYEELLQYDFGINNAVSDIITSIILFFIIGCEFFINYKIVFRRKEIAAEKEAEQK